MTAWLKMIHYYYYYYDQDFSPPWSGLLTTTIRTCHHHDHNFSPPPSQLLTYHDQNISPPQSELLITMIRSSLSPPTSWDLGIHLYHKSGTGHQSDAANNNWPAVHTHSCQCIAFRKHTLSGQSTTTDQIFTIIYANGSHLVTVIALTGIYR